MNEEIIREVRSLNPKVSAEWRGGFSGGTSKGWDLNHYLDLGEAGKILKARRDIVLFKYLKPTEEIAKRKAQPCPIIAVSLKDLEDFGCPYCGCHTGTNPISGMGSVVWRCSECGKTSVGLTEGMTKSSIGIGSYYPKLQDHPRNSQS